MVHVLQNWKQKGMLVHVCAASILDEGMYMALPRRAPYSPRRPEGGSLAATRLSALKTMAFINMYWGVKIKTHTVAQRWNLRSFNISKHEGYF